MKKPVILGVAVTNRPHIRLKKHPMQVVDKAWFESNSIASARDLEEDEKLIRVPFLIAGKYRHPKGDLDFTPEVFDRMLENAKKGVGDFDEGLDRKHNPDNPDGMLGWFTDGGWLAREGNALVGYAKPTSDKALAQIENKEFKYASVEFAPNYRSNLKQTYLSTELDTVIIEEEDVMDEVTLSKQDHDALKLEAEKVSGLETELQTIKDSLEELKTQIANLTKEKEDLVNEKADLEKKLSGDIEEEDEKVLALQRQVLELQKREVERSVDLILAEARIPVDGKGHTEAVLDACRNFMLGQDIGDTVKLEAEDDVYKFGAYARDFIKYLLTETLPRTVALESGTKGEEGKLPVNLFEAGKKLGATLWQN